MPLTLTKPKSEVPRPREGESQPSFAIRFHTAMQKRIPDTDARERACRAAWDRANPSTEVERIARRRFPAEKFVRVDAVPYFQEHAVEDQGPDGTSIKKRYTRDVLARMVELNNDRAIDAGLFAPVAEGHTPTEEQAAQGAKEPQVRGYAGCYRLGMVGRKRPRFCIFADEFHHKEDADKLRRLARRSVEVWEDGTIDPVAALGATTPRLDMGMTRFCRDRSGQRVSRYAAMPAASNVYVPGFGEDSEPHRNARGGKMAPEEVAQIIDALMDTAPMQWVVQQMQGAPDNLESGDGLDVEEQADDMGEGTPADDTAPPADDSQSDTLSDDEMADMDDDERADYDSLEDDQKAVYARGRRRGKGFTKPAMSKPMKLSRQGNQTDAERYAREKAARDRKNALQKQIDGMQSQIEQLQRGKRHAERYARLQEKQGEGYSFDLEDEFSELKDVSDEEFGRAIKRVEKYSRAPVNGDFLPTPALPVSRDAQKADQYAKKRAELARKIALSEGIDYGVALQKAEKQLGD